MNKFILTTCLSLVCALGVQAQASKPYAQLNFGAADSTCKIAPSTATNVYASIDMTLQKDMAFFFQANADATETGNCIWAFSPSFSASDLTLMDSNQVFTFTKSLTTAGVRVVASTNWSGQAYSGYQGIAGYPYLILRYITNADATANFTNVALYYAPKRTPKSGN